jgi:L-arabinose isomerase
MPTDRSNIPDKLRLGLFGIGLDAYWPQFSGLQERLEGYLHVLDARLRSADVEVVNLGLVDSPEAALSAGHAFRQADIDLLFLYVTTYALSSTVLPVIMRAKTPVVILNLQPTSAIDYRALNQMQDRGAMTGEWLAYCSACPVPEIANVMARAGIPFHQVTGVLTDDPVSEQEIHAWVQAAAVARTLSHTRIGLMGHYYSGMLDIATDLTQLAITFGCHMEWLEVDELSQMRLQVSASDSRLRAEEFCREFEVQPDCPEAEMLRAASTSIALEQFVQRHDLGALAYYYKGTGVAVNEETISSIILGSSWLTARGVPVAGEYETKNVVAMKILQCFGAGGSFTEYYAMDFNDDVVLMGHDGPGHTAIAEGKTKVRPLGVYHGKVGNGLSVEMSVRFGPVTLLSVVEDRACGFKLLVAEGESVPGETLQIGNTNSRYRFPVGARGFVEAWNAQGPAHHCAVGVGHLSSRIDKLAKLLGIPMFRVC